MLDILTRLPPNATITGFVGDSGRYLNFSVRAETARTEIAAICAAHASEYAGGYPTHTTPASYWFYGETVVACDAYPGLVLYIDVECAPGKQPDIRVDPWVITRIDFDLDSFNMDPVVVATLFREVGAFLTHLTSEV